MESREDIDRKYIDQAAELEAEYFRIINAGKPDQHRELKAGKSLDDFNHLHGESWRNHEAELIAAGYLEPTPEPEPARDLGAELDALENRVSQLEAKP